ncbi:aspartokinase 3 [Halolactibacillus alkaliphilus]|uniref:Aspartokinase n=1 Tax=Halolactibacillus alkaliphilus TaxID=442899 RepID=A0A511X2T0_9BACI|nr:aspartate kinase [Halolactibacillus alkaliphilus]GEN57221.1 aspartokinase 3 [Halolactibacillus alkaliphilus]GGN68748.1 aspartokinase 3 [Halolactibacillus alkaliphilus]SFO72953.1 aspartate kinase [Halolactibacillus alkaliphilus]
MKVAKFGGSSVANAEQLKKVANIIQSDADRKIIVVSAPGKRNSDDIKVTDLLIDLGEAYRLGQSHEQELQRVVDRFEAILEELHLSKDVLHDIQTRVRKIFNDGNDLATKLDAIKAIGEDSLAKILSEYLVSLGMHARYVNPKEAGLILSDQPGSAQILDESFKLIHQLTKHDEIMVIPGFFGYTKEGKLVTFSRGGSDITGSIVAAGVKADLYENFTDVDSVYCVNPQIVKNPKEITSLTYKEMRELSYAGFSVFHAEALIPAFKERIPVCIKNTNNPGAKGTMIVNEKAETNQAVVGIASDTGFVSLYVSKYLMNREIGFGRRLLNILEDEGISFEHTPSGIDDLSVIIRENQLTEEKEAIVINRINKELKPDTVYIDRRLALIMIVGEGMHSFVGTAAKATKAFEEADVNLEMINQGSSEVSMMFGIKEEGVKRAVQSLYRVFFEEN